MLTFVVVVVAVFYFVFFFCCCCCCCCLFVSFPTFGVHMPFGWKEWDAPVLFQSSLSSRSQTKIYIKGFPELLSGFILIGSRQDPTNSLALKNRRIFSLGCECSDSFRAVSANYGANELLIHGCPISLAFNLSGHCSRSTELFISWFIHSFIHSDDWQQRCSSSQ